MSHPPSDPPWPQAPAGLTVPAARRSPAAPTLRERFKAGGWYFVVPILSAGVFTGVPFWHAAVRLGRPVLWRPTIFYSVCGIGSLTVSNLIPKDAVGEPIGRGAAVAENILVAVALLLIVAACVQLRPIRREVYGGPVATQPVAPTAGDPAVARVLERRARRLEARTLAENDLDLARKFGIGRPDLGRGYDDGGLVDVNSAPAELIAGLCDMDPAHGRCVADARRARGGSFFNMDEVFVYVALPPAAEAELRDRGIALDPLRLHPAAAE